MYGQLRIVSYNTAMGGVGTRNPRTGMDTVLQAIGNEAINGISRPIDLLMLQEQYTVGTATAALVDVMNGLYAGVASYDRGTINGAINEFPPISAGRPGLVYNTNTLQLLDEIPIGNNNGNGIARQPMRYQLRPVGYGSDADFYVYVSHYKASTGSTNVARRNVEAQAIRADADNLGEGTRIVYAGDFNVYTSSEPMYQTLMSSGNGQAFDPANAPNWSSASLRYTHTQSPTNSNCNDGTLVTGGVDDRFDFQLVTGELNSNEGLSYIGGSYRAFGNNGSTYNDPINVGNTSGIASNVLDALACVSDHLPVVADYQLPAVLDAFAATPPQILNVGQPFILDLTVSNIADVLSSNGADELDYSYSVSGTLSGSGSGSDLALGTGNRHTITLDTSSPGTKSGTITVTTSSPQVPNASVNIPIEYTVTGSGGGSPPLITVAMQESFESAPGAGYTLTTAFDDGFDFFNRYAVPDSTNAARDDFSQFDGSFAILGQDHDGPQGPGATATVSISNIDISGKSNLTFTGLFGAIEGEPSFQNFEPGDGFSIFTSVDGSSPVLIGAFAANSAAGSDLYLDTNLDGVGDGTRLTDELGDYLFAIPGTGSTLDITIEMLSNESFEALVVDNIRVSGETPALPGDANLDGTVDDIDFGIWSENRFQASMGWGDADFNFDGITDVSDFNIWHKHRTMSINPIAVLAASVVPEPSGWILVVMAGVGLSRRGYSDFSPMKT